MTVMYYVLGAMIGYWIAYMERDILNDLVQKIEGDFYERNI